MAEYSDIAFHIHEGIARITIDRPDRYNAFRALTCEELIDAFNKAGWDRSVGVIVLTGAGGKGSAPAGIRERMKAAMAAAARSGCRSRNCTV